VDKNKNAILIKQNIIYFKKINIYISINLIPLESWKNSIEIIFNEKMKLKRDGCPMTNALKLNKCSLICVVCVMK